MKTIVMNKLINGVLCDKEPSTSEISAAYSDYILSASGFRKIFGENRNEESNSSRVSDADLVIAGVLAASFVQLLETLSIANPLIIVGTDSRPTGTALASGICRFLSTKQVSVQYIGTASSPEIMAYARSKGSGASYIYISASHNPIGHNGFKTGLDSGGVLNAAQAKQLIELFNKNIANPKLVSEVIELFMSSENDTYTALASNREKYKKQSLEAYEQLTREIFSGSSDPARQEASFRELQENVTRNQLGILADFNGSARIDTIDRAFFEKIGIQFSSFNDKLGEIAHRIVPEGESLDFCRDELTKLAKKSPAYLIGYLPDNDGDRGNLVWYDKKRQSASVIAAQEVFALVVLAELCQVMRSPEAATKKVAVVVNDPTSNRIDDLAHILGVEVHRAEVGEANVVGLAYDLRTKGYIVRVLGEGSNGGNITHPGAVRDPLQTILSVLRLYLVRDKGTQEGIFHFYCKKAGLDYNDSFDFTDLLNALPAYVTTSAYEENALLKISQTDHAALKRNFEDVFLAEWEDKKDELSEKFGIRSYDQCNYEGGVERIGFGPRYRTGPERGGLKIRLFDEQQRQLGFLWMRGSATEPIFRVMVDVKGSDADAEKYLIRWLRAMVQKADLVRD